MAKDDIERIMEQIHDLVASIDEDLFNDIDALRRLAAIELALYDAAEIPRPDRPTSGSPSGSAAAA